AAVFEAHDNLDGDPLYVPGPAGRGDYFLSQVAAGQDANSPALDAGNKSAIAAGLNTRTTRTDNLFDAGQVDLGYHYVDAATLNQYQLSIIAIGNGTIEPAPGAYTVYEGAIITLIATPEPGYRVRRWTGTADDSSLATVNTIVVAGDSVVTVEFELVQVRTIHVTGAYTYPTIQDALNIARSGDTVVIHPDIYPVFFLSNQGKSITITSAVPDDPCVVRATVLDFADEIGSGFSLFGNHAVLNGLTLTNSRWGIIPAPSPPDGPGLRGFNGGSVLTSGTLRISGNHIVANCIISNANRFGGNASSGNDGDDDAPGGGDGGNGGSAGGAGISVSWGTPSIRNCIVENCTVQAGAGGDGGDGGGDFGSGGNGGVPGAALGAGIYVAPWANPEFIECTVRNCTATGSTGGTGGDAGNFALGGFGGLTTYDPNQIDPRNFTARGGGVHCASHSHPVFVDCTFAGNATVGSVAGLGGAHWWGELQQPRLSGTPTRVTPVVVSPDTAAELPSTSPVITSISSARQSAGLLIATSSAISHPSAAESMPSPPMSMCRTAISPTIYLISGPASSLSTALPPFGQAPSAGTRLPEMQVL
ncbi:MAG: InlB B-repeat-containing protein, partial [Planctomycetota bacterium]